MCDDDDKCGCGCYLILVGAVLTFIFMTVASPGFLLYGFFSTEWLTEDIDYLPTIATDRTWYSGDGGGDDDYNDDYYGRYRTTTTTRTDPNNKVHYGLFWKCYQGDCEEEILDKTTFGLEVAAVTFQFLAILALPWLKFCFPQNKVFKYWNYCFLPFLFIADFLDLINVATIRKGSVACHHKMRHVTRTPVFGAFRPAVMSLSGSLYFLRKYSIKDNIMSHDVRNGEVGQSQVCAGLGGGFQVVLTCVILFFFLKHRRASQRPTTYVSNVPAVSSVSTASSVTAATRTERTTHTSRFQWFEDRVMGVFMYEMETVTTTEVERRGHEVQRIDRY